MKKIVVYLFLAALLTVSFFSSFEKKPKLLLPKKFVKIPGGSLTSEVDRVTIREFYLSKYEISNQEYDEFLSSLLKEENFSVYEKALIDSSQWSTLNEYTEPLVKNYHRHPAYKNYPVLNISYEAAMLYCSWLQEKLSHDNIAYKISVRLPTPSEWEWAAKGGNANALYPWKNYYLRDKNGQYLCNYRRINEAFITANPITGAPEYDLIPEGINARSVYTSPVNSFSPNAFDLYNMSGNASEMISEKNICMGGSWNSFGGDVRTTSKSVYKKASPTVGFRPVIEVREK